MPENDNEYIDPSCVKRHANIQDAALKEEVKPKVESTATSIASRIKTITLKDNQLLFAIISISLIVIITFALNHVTGISWIGRTIYRIVFFLILTHIAIRFYQGKAEIESAAILTKKLIKIGIILFFATTIWEVFFPGIPLNLSEITKKSVATIRNIGQPFQEKRRLLLGLPIITYYPYDKLYELDPIIAGQSTDHWIEIPVDCKFNLTSSDKQFWFVFPDGKKIPEWDKTELPKMQKYIFRIEAKETQSDLMLKVLSVNRIKVFHTGTYYFELNPFQMTEYKISFPPQHHRYSFSSDDYNYNVIFDNGTVLKDGPNVRYPDMDPAIVKLQALSTPQTIKLVVEKN